MMQQLSASFCHQGNGKGQEKVDKKAEVLLSLDTIIRRRLPFSFLYLKYKQPVVVLSST